jgi:putative ABC transport system permease protein
LIAGLLPSLYLSSFKPVAVLKGLKLNDGETLSLRKSLVVVQFSISISLIIGSLIVVRQMSFISNAKLGLNKEQVMVIKNTFSLTPMQQSALYSALRQIPEVKNAAPSSSMFGSVFSTTRINKKGSDKKQQLNFMSVGYDFLDVLGIKIKEGRGFSAGYPADTINNAASPGAVDRTIGSIVINETAVKEFGIDSPFVGQQLTRYRRGDTIFNLNIVGIAKDFHFTSLRNEVKPFGFVVEPSRQSNITLKLATGNIDRTLANLQKVWNSLSPVYPFEYVFLDETFAKMYDGEARFKKVFIILVAISIIISCLGLFALATFSAEQRIKEIGIRKVLGASVPHLVILLSKDYLKLVLISLIIATPVAWYAMSRWLQDFAYRINIEWWIFVLAAAIAAVIALVTVSFHAVKAALTNPVVSLKME